MHFIYIIDKMLRLYVVICWGCKGAELVVHIAVIYASNGYTMHNSVCASAVRVHGGCEM